MSGKRRQYTPEFREQAARLVIETGRPIGQVVTACDAWDIPLVLESVLIGAPRTEEEIVEEEKVGRIAYDLGAHIIKIAFPGEERTRRLVDELKVPLVIAGGPLAGEPSETVDAVAQTIRAGARGVIVGRNIWQRERNAAAKVCERVVRSGGEQAEVRVRLACPPTARWPRHRSGPFRHACPETYRRATPRSASRLMPSAPRPQRPPRRRPTPRGGSAPPSTTTSTHPTAR